MEQAAQKAEMGSGLGAAAASEQLFSYEPCPLCGATPSKPLYSIDIAYAANISRLKLEDAVGVHGCQRCGHEFIQPVPQPAFLKAFYASYMSQAKDGFYREQHQATIPESFRRRYGCWLERIMRLQQGPASLLDIGAGMGMFVRLAREAGFTVAGVEPNAEAARWLRSQHGIAVENCLLEELDSPAHHDVVTMWDLLEHLPSPRRAIEKAHEALRPGGLLVLEIPVRDSLIHRLVKAVWVLSAGRIRRPLFLVCGLHHLQYFTAEAVSGLLAESGFEVVEAHRAETDVRLLCRRYRGGLLARGKTAAFNAALRACFALARLTGRQNKLVVIARRRGGGGGPGRP